MRKLTHALLGLFLLASCQPKQSENDQAISESAQAEREIFFANLRRPTEVAAGLQATAADFNEHILSDPSKFSQYMVSDAKAAANLGIYLSDMNYCIAYKKSDFTKKYFEAARELAKVMGVEKNVLEFIGKRYQDNINQNDSVKAAFDELFEKANSSLKGTEKERLIGISMAAYQIENLHLTLGIINSYPKDMLPEDARMTILVPLFKLVFAQGDRLKNIYGFLRIAGNPENPDYQYYANAFEELISTYDKLNVKETISNNEGIALLNDQVVADLLTKVDQIRNKATEVK